MDTSAHLIEVVETVTEEVSATGAEVRIRLSGAKYFSGSAALEQASEVRKLVDALTAAGLAASDLGIASVRVDTSKSLSLHTPSATYEVLVKCRDPKQVPLVIDAASTVGKTCALHGVVWLSEVPEAIENGWLAKAVRQARDAATAIVEAASVKLGAQHRIVDETHDPSQERRPPGEPRGYGGGSLDSGSMMRNRSVADRLENLELAPKESRRVSVRASFEVLS